MRFNEIINEAEARIQHAEDLVFFQGSAGANRALDSLSSMGTGGHTSATIKWDGSPAVIFVQVDLSLRFSALGHALLPPRLLDSIA